LLLLLLFLLGRKTVKFVTNCEVQIEDQKVWKGKNVERPAQPKRVGRMFAGWYTDEDCTNRWDFEIDTGYTWSGRDNAYRLEAVSKDRLISYIMDIEGKTKAEAGYEIKAIEFKTDYPEYSSISSTTIAKYYEKVEDTNYTLADKGIDIEEFADYCVKVSGKTMKEDKLKVINKLPLSSSQKDALYYFNGWAKSTLYEAPWH
jgi:hypothetical protein